jgi:hypothetical protein
MGRPGCRAASCPGCSCRQCAMPGNRSIVTPPHACGFSGSLRLKGQPGPQDVHGGVHVRVCRMAACETPELRLADAVPRSDMPALSAALRGVTGIHCDHRAAGALSLAAQDSQESAPSRVEDGLVQPGFRRRAVGRERSVFREARFRPPGHVRRSEAPHGRLRRCRGPA